MQNLKQKLASSVGLFFRLIKAFLNIEDDDSKLRKTYKGTHALVKRVTYLSFDYWLTALEALLAITLFEIIPRDGFVLTMIVFLILWIFEIFCALAFILFWKKTGIDITLSEDWRRVIDEVHRNSKFFGKIAYLAKVIKAIIWDGPEEIVIFCHKELKSPSTVTVVLLGVTAFQAAFWGGAFISIYQFITSIFW